MDVPERLRLVAEDIGRDCGTDRFYVIDVDEQANEELAGTFVFGMRDSLVPSLAARQKASARLATILSEPVGVEVFSEPLDEVEYLFDRYLRAYIASHGGIVTPVEVDEQAGKLSVHFDGGCSGCPASIATLKHGIEKTLKKHLPWLQRVDSVNEAQEPDFGIKLDLSAGAFSTVEER